MVDRDVVYQRLATLRLNARRLEVALAAGRERFSSDENLYLMAERCLQLAIQAMLDIGTHIIADQGLNRPAGYEEVVPELGRAGILPAELVERLSGIAGLRNILVHDYLTVDHERMFDDLTSGLGDFEEFARAIEALASSAE
jgi:uncharacterized protein YutE (UPF0331/DUF86 family)